MRMAAEPSERDTNSASAAATPAPELSAGSIRLALDKILSSPGFINADRLTRFLRYTVEETLNGQTDKLKETLLGIEVFNRKTTYDPRVDAVVRTEAVKLRARLRDYYDSEGREDGLIIDLPKGGYVPAFRIREKVPETQPAAAIETYDNTRRGHDWRPAIAGGVILVVLAVSIFLTTRVRKHVGPGAGGPEVASIAVLPFADLSPDRDQEYFCDGMTEEIIDALAKVDGFRVVARTSSFAFKGKQQDIREIGKKLNVGAVLEGSVRKDGNLLRVTAQLNSVSDGYHLWSQTYERELKDVFSVQDEIAKAIVNTLQLKLATPRPKRAVNVEAYDLYLQGRYHWNRWRLEGAERGLQFFEQATQKDPKYAAAYAGIADSYAWLGFFGNVAPSEAMPKARAAADKAIALDDTLAEAHTSLGYVKALYDYDWSGAEREFLRAIQLNPGLADAHFGYGIVFLAPQERGAEALREMLLARDLDPLRPSTPILRWRISSITNPTRASPPTKKPSIWIRTLSKRAWTSRPTPSTTRSLACRNSKLIWRWRRGLPPKAALNCSAHSHMPSSARRPKRSLWSINGSSRSREPTSVLLRSRKYMQSSATATKCMPGSIAPTRNATACSRT